ncbi:MAG: Hsp20/alpha crystallin family protein [Desulfomonilaceae bacterium]
MIQWRLGTDPTWRELERLKRSMDDLFTTASGTRRPSLDPWWRGARLFPLLNVKDLGQSYVVTAEIPGMKAADLEIKIEGDTLTLKGERKPQGTGDEISYHRRERTTGTFQRSLPLPGKVDAENASATYKDGVLTVTLQKEKVALPRQIAVQRE